MKTPTKPSYRVRLARRQRSTLQLLTDQRQVRTAAPRSPKFDAVVKQALEDWSGSTDQLAALDAELRASETAILALRGRLHTAREQYLLDERRYASGVELTAGGDPDVIRALACDPIGGQLPAIGALEPPTALRATPGTDPGTVQLAWSVVRGARSYALERSADPPSDGSWTALPGRTGVRRAVDGLAPGARYWFRVASIGAAGQSRFSDPVIATAR